MHEAKLCLSLLALAEPHLSQAEGGRIVGLSFPAGGSTHPGRARPGAR